MLIDSFLIFDEVDLALFRIKYLSEYVDKVIVAESSLTHSGAIKPLHFSDYLSRVSPSMAHNIEVLRVDLSAFSDSWSREISSREALIHHILANHPNARFINSDLDEIPSLDSVKLFLELPPNNYHFQTQTYYRFANWALLDSHSNWNRGVFGIAKLPFPENGGRFAKLPTIFGIEKGAHLSYLGRNSNSIAKKLESFAHTELNKTALKSREFIEFADQNVVDHLGRSRNRGFGILKILAENQLSSLHKELYQNHPGYFSFPVRVPFLLTRFFASVVCSIIANDRPGCNNLYALYFEKNITWKTFPVGLFSIFLETAFSLFSFFLRKIRITFKLFLVRK